jgi:hypothetical protein
MMTMMTMTIRTQPPTKGTPSMKHANRAPRTTGAPGTKSLITALAIATTLVGWAHLTAQEPPNAASSGLSNVPIVAPPPAWLLEPVVIPSLPAGGSNPASASAPVFSAPAAPAPAAALRAVSALPAPVPVTTTRSSR